MKQIMLPAAACLTILIFSVCISCNGQADTENPAHTALYAQGTPKLQKNSFYDSFREASVNVHCGLQDHKGDMWFGTTGNGLYRFDGTAFTNFTTAQGLSSNCIWTLLEDRAGNIWIGTDAGLCFYDGAAFYDIGVSTGGFKYMQVGTAAENNTAQKNEVFSLLQDKAGTIWLGTAKGVYCYKLQGKPQGGYFSRFPDKPEVINDSALTLRSVQCMLEDRNGNIWFGSGPMAFEGIVLFDGKGLSQFKPNGETWVRTIFQDSSGTIWFGTRHFGGLCYDGKAFRPFTQKEHIGNPMLQDGKGNIWFSGDEQIGTVENEGGIWRYDGTTFRNFRIGDGISKYAVFFMMADRNHNIWIGTRNSGLYRYDGSRFLFFSE